MNAIFYKLILLAFVALGLISCNNGASLEEYYIEHKENPDFVTLDVPTSLITPDSKNLTPEQYRVLQTVKKINILALPLNSKTQSIYEHESLNVKEMLNHDNFQELMTFGKPSQRMQLFFKGDEDAIDEVVVFARDDSKGFMLARLLGDNMNVGDMVKFAQTIGKSKDSLDISQFEGGDGYF